MPTKKLFVFPRDFQILPTALQNASQCSRVGDGQCYNTIETQVNPPHFTLAKNRLHYLLPLCCARSFKLLEYTFWFVFSFQDILSEKEVRCGYSYMYLRISDFNSAFSRDFYFSAFIILWTPFPVINFRPFVSSLELN